MPSALVRSGLKSLVAAMPGGRTWLETRQTQTPIQLPTFVAQKVLGMHRDVYWPVHPSSVVQNWRNIVIGIETSPGLMPGCYIQGSGGIVLGDYTQVAPGVGIISGNHSVTDNRVTIAKQVNIGAYCWLAMHSVILPGVTLGDFTVVGAGAIVTKSFPEGYVVLGGNPARPIRTLDPAECVRHKSAFEYHGYVPAAEFAAFRRRHLSI